MVTQNVINFKPGSGHCVF